MLRRIVMFLIFLGAILGGLDSARAQTRYYIWCLGLNGGGADYLDTVNTADFLDGSVAYTAYNGTFYYHRLDTSLSTTAQPPYIIAPISGPGRWVWQIPVGPVALPRFERSSTTSLTVSEGRYPVVHTTGDMAMVAIPDQITLTLTSLAADDVSYLYVDASAVAANGHPVLSAAEIYDSVTDPLPDPDRRGYYHPTNTDDLCIAGFLADASAEIVNFTQQGENFYYTSQFTDLPLTDIDTTWVTITHTVPSFSRVAMVRVTSSVDTSSNFAYIRMRPYGATDYWVIHSVDAGAARRASSSLTIPIDSNQRSQIVHSDAGDHSSRLYTEGYALGMGMF